MAGVDRSGPSRRNVLRLAAGLGALAATDHNRYAHADGAMRSGIREAKRLLRRASVALSAG